MKINKMKLTKYLKAGRKPRKLIFYILLFSFHVSLFTFYVSAQQPTLEWEKRYSGLQNNGSNGISVKLDSFGNIYVLVRVATDTTLGDYGLLKYNPSGDLLWSASYNSPANLSELPKAFCVTQAGDVFITGNSGINFVEHITTVKFNSSGIFQWASEYNGGYNDGAGDIALDKQGNIIICGGSAVNNNIAYALAIKYSSSGDSLWVRKFMQYSYSYTGRLVIDDSSNVYTSGYYTVSISQSNYLILKYNPAGNQAWFSSYGVTGYGAIANSIAIDSNRYVYVVGVLNVPQPSYWDNVLVKINPNGTLQWAKNYTGINNNHACSPTPTGVTIVPDGSRIFYTTSCNAPGSAQFVTLSYYSSGDTNWTKKYPIGVTGIPQLNPVTLKIDKYNNIYITGNCYDNSTGDDYISIKYLPTGLQQWVTTYNGFNNYGDYANDIIIDTSIIYVTGISKNSANTISDAVTIKYNQPIGIISNVNELPKQFKLYQNYPNPFNAETVISYALPRGAIVELNIYNALGQLVKRLVNGEQQSSYYSIILNTQDLASGVYFYSLMADNMLIETKKLILLK